MIRPDFGPFIYFYRIMDLAGMAELHHHFSLKDNNTFGITCYAALYSRPGTLEELKSVMEEHAPEVGSFLVIGEGSNILFQKDFEGLVLHPAFMGIQLIEQQGNQVVVRVGAGEHWDDWVAYATSQGWYGLENLSLIPGSVGSAPIQNIGAYGVSLNEHFAWLDAYDPVKKEVVRLNREQCRFGYRSSIFKTVAGSRYIITGVAFLLHTRPVLKLDYGNVKEEFSGSGGKTPEDLRKLIISIRNRKLPDPSEFGNAGSFFKNPMVDMPVFKCIRTAHPEVPYYPGNGNSVKIPAAWLIETAGWKGKRIGNVGTWPRQPLVVVNFGGATGQEILDFTEQIRDDVDRKFGIHLEREVRVV